MEWPPRWLGSRYSRLWSVFGEELFTIDAGAKVLGSKPELLLIVLSQLRRRGFLVVFRRIGLRRLYRLLEPSSVVNAVGVRQPLHLKQPQYMSLVLKGLLALKRAYLDRLGSVILFGSVARGNAKPESDLDLLVVADFYGSAYSRIDELCQIEYEGCVAEEIRWLRKNGLQTHINWIPMTPAEASMIRPIYLDLAEDAVLLYDREAFFESVLKKVRSRMLELGSQRIWLDEERWFWKVKAKVEQTEAVSL